MTEPKRRAPRQSPANVALAKLQAALDAGDRTARDAALADAIDAGNEVVVLASITGLTPSTVLGASRGARRARRLATEGDSP